MKIKKVAILGFKSFMDRFEFSFPLGISGIVGPNGSGKSNVVDAIRWCLGEQSPKQLRGRQMEDVIFSGAGGYKSMGMAEVSLTFENGNGSGSRSLIDYSDVMITRRLYRSGESEYRINNDPCRLKDIQEFFMDTGLGNKTYSIIGQGKIGSILEQRPEETREMLEEAAGVTKYRKKVEASVKKIELTNGNLQRVEDILGEINSQIVSLKRQAAKARRYKEISERMQGLELFIHANVYGELKDESGDKLEKTENMVRQEIEKTTELTNLLTRVEETGFILARKEDSIKGLRSDYFLLKERVHKKEVNLEALSGEIKMQEDFVSRLRHEENEIKNSLAGLVKDKEAYSLKIHEIEEDSIKLDTEIILMEKRFKTKAALLHDIKGNFDQIKSRLHDGAKKELGLNHESGYLKKMIHQITDGRGRLEKELGDVKTAMNNVVELSDKKFRLREDAVGKLKEVESSIDRHNANMEELELIKNRVERELKEAERDLNACSTRLSSLQGLVDNFEGYIVGVRTIMKADDFKPSQQGHLLGIVADMIQVEAGYEQAVEAVLADRLQSIVVESYEDGRLGVEYLKSKARGRSSFIPFRELKYNNSPCDMASYKPLMDFVNTNEENEILVKSLLGESILVNSLNDGISIWKSLVNSSSNGCKYSFVTIEGDMIDHRGIITGGKSANDSGGLLVRKREMEQLKNNRIVFKNKVEHLRLQLENVHIDFAEKKGILKKLTDEKWECKEKVNEYDKKLFRVSQELDQLEKLANKITGDIEKKKIDHTTHEKELLKIEEKLRQCTRENQKEELFIKEKELELKETEKEFEKIREELQKLKSKYQICNEERRGLKRELERLDQYSDEANKRNQRIEDDIRQSHARRDECQKRMGSLRDDLKELYEKLEKAENQVNESERERQDLQNNVKEHEKKAEQKRKEIAELKENINQAKMEHSGIQFKLNNIEETVKERFNLHLAEIYHTYIKEDFSRIHAEQELDDLKMSRQRLGEVNLMAIKEYEALEERYAFVTKQREDLLASIETLQTTIRKINKISLEKFRATFYAVDEKLKEIFPILFNGGSAGLKLTDENRPLESGVLVQVYPPGKKINHMGMLSGGEKTLVAMALLFAIYMIKPSPFCLLDEVDAPLDEANIDRFNNLLEEIKKASQIIMVTHSKRTMEIADQLYGITMEKAGVSKIVSVDLKKIKERNRDHSERTFH